MNHLGLFEGIGGFSLAAHWMGWQTKAWVEINPSCQKELKKKFPEAKGYGDIKEFDGTKYRGTIDIVTGGFPCQTFSLAGKGEMDLSLWKEMFRVICECRPKVVVAENVYGLLARKQGVALEAVCFDLESQGYTVLPPLIIPACSKDAPHQRDRLWIVAYSESFGFREYEAGNNNDEKRYVQKQEQRFTKPCRTGATWQIWSTSNTNTPGFQKRVQSGKYCFQRKAKPFHGREFTRTYPKSDWSEFPTESPLYIRNDGLPTELVRRNARLRKRGIEAAGNAIVPQVAFDIFKAIELTL